MVLIKVSDISNEARPMDIAEPWLDRLLQEFFKQSDAEKLEGLPVTPFMDREKITKPSSQCSFIGFVLLPLFEALGELFVELQVIWIDAAHIRPNTTLTTLELEEMYEYEVFRYSVISSDMKLQPRSKKK